MNNIIIVESNTDKFFIEKLIEHLNISNSTIAPPINSDFESLEGMDKLKYRLDGIIKNSQYNKIGIVIDADESGIEARLEFINSAVNAIWGDIEIKTMDTLFRSDEADMEFAAHITNIDGKGELETILRKIKNKDSPHADCLMAWKECLEQKDQKITDKAFTKFWLNNYLRFDTCDNKHRSQAERYCSLGSETAIKKDIWDLNHPALDQLKNFLHLFK